MTYQPKTTREQERKVTLTNYVPDDIEDRSRMVSKFLSKIDRHEVDECAIWKGSDSVKHGTTKYGTFYVNKSSEGWDATARMVGRRNARKRASIYLDMGKVARRFKGWSNVLDGL